MQTRSSGKVLYCCWVAQLDALVLCSAVPCYAVS